MGRPIAHASRPALLCLVALACPLPAQAGNEDELMIGNRAALVGGAVSATVRDGSTIWHNPAGLGGVQRSTIDVSASAYTLRHYGSDRFVASVDGRSKRASVMEFVAVPTQVAYVFQVADGTSLGVGYFSPRSTSLLVRERLDLEASIWSFDVSLLQSTWVFGAAIGRAVSERLRWGVGLLGFYDAATASAAMFGAVRDGGQVVKTSQLDAFSTESNFALEAVAGLQFSLTDALTVSLSARSPRLQLLRSQVVAVSQSQGQREPAGQPILLAETPAVPPGGPALQVSRAGRYKLGIAYAIGDGWVSLEGDLMPGLRDAGADLRRRLTWNARLGLYQPLWSGISLGVGVFTDRTAEPEVSPEALLSRAGDFYGATLGIELSNKHDLADDERADSFVLSTFFSLRYAFSDSDTLAVRVDPDAPVEDLIGRTVTPLFIQELGLYVGSALAF
ncbi:MAG: hypothetical protein OXU20_28520 [Myxococcales bacterium]|nr:hypothetical protein [Myxococcales bacterium]